MVKRALLAAAFGAAALLIGAGEVRAQSCGLPDDVPASLFDMYADVIGGLFPLGQAECNKIAKDALATCQKAVSAEVACWEQAIKGLAKGVKVGCKAQGPDEEECNTMLGAEIAGAILSLQAAELEGREDCEVGGETFYFFCLNPF